MNRLEDFDLDYQIAPIRNLVPQPHIVSLYVTSFVIEQLIKHKDVVDIFGSDEEIYYTIKRASEKVFATIMRPKFSSQANQRSL